MNQPERELADAMLHPERRLPGTTPQGDGVSDPMVLQLSDRLRRVGDPIEVQREAARAVGEQVGANRVGYAEILEDGETSVVTVNYTNGVRGIEGRYRVADYSPTLLASLKAGQTVVRADVERMSELSDAERSAHVALQVGATVDIPLLKGERLVAVLFMHFAEAHAFSNAEITLLEALAERTWDAVERARTEAALRATEARLRLALDLAELGTWSWNLLNGSGDLDTRAAQIVGLREGALPDVASAQAAVIHTEDLAAVQAAVAAGIAADMPFALRYRVVHSDGREHHVVSHAILQRDHAGQPSSIMGINRDATRELSAEIEREALLAASERARTAAERTAARTAQLQTLTAALAAARTAGDVADVVTVDMVRALDARKGALAARADDGAGLVLLRQTGFPDDVLPRVQRQAPDFQSPLLEAFETKAPVWIESREGPGGLDVRYPPMAPVWDRIELHAAAFIPLVVANESVGVMSFGFGEPRTFAPEERAVLVALGQQAALAVARAHLSEAERVARAQAEAAESRAEFLASLGETLQPLEDPDELMAATARMMGRHLGVDRCAYAEVEDDEDTFTITGDYTRGDTTSIVGRYAFRAFGEECRRLMRANEPYVVQNVDEDARIDEADRVAYRNTQIHAVICVPLHKGGRFVAAMAVHQRVPRDWSASEIDIVVTVVRRCWESLERARAYRSLREREAALRAASAQLVERTAAAEASQHAAEAANRAKSEFLAIMSHELRTPLNAIGGYAELMEIGVRGPVTPEQRADLARIQRSQRTLLGLINGVLNYAKLDAGAVDYAVQEVRLDEVLTACEALVAPQARAKGLLLQQVCSAPPPVARADGEKVEQIVRNLLSNAIKFTGTGGSVALECVTEELQSHVVVRVRDSGIGIAEVQLERIFQPFVQLDSRLTRTYEGTGLGLAISRELARGMGGDLTASSQVGHGSTFTLSLPRA